MPSKADKQDDVRRDVWMILSVYRDLANSGETHLRDRGLGRSHYQLLLCIHRRPAEMVSYYLATLNLKGHRSATS